MWLSWSLILLSHHFYTVLSLLFQGSRIVVKRCIRPKTSSLQVKLRGISVSRCCQEKMWYSAEPDKICRWWAFCESWYASLLVWVVFIIYSFIWQLATVQGTLARRVIRNVVSHRTGTAYKSTTLQPSWYFVFIIFLNLLTIEGF